MRGLTRRLLVGACAAAALVLGACATRAPTTPSAASSTPMLRLAPAALGRTLAVQQSIVVDVRAQRHAVQALLEADASAVRLALLHAGQTGATLVWDGRELHQQQAPWWPAAVSGERVLSDLQLVWWPAAAVAAGLPAGWRLDHDAGSRTLREGDTAVIAVRYLGADQAELDHLRLGYRLTIRSRALEAGS